jgi:hypothetical protein
MMKRKVFNTLERLPKKINASTDFVYYQSALHHKIQRVSATKIGKRPKYRLFIDYDGKYIPLRCILVLGSTSFGILPEAANPFSIRVVRRPWPIK